MKPDQLLQELKDLAEKLGITVLEQNFRSTGVRAKSGYCLIRDKEHYILDKHKRLKTKTILLGKFLSGRQLDDLFIVPAVREFLNRQTPSTATSKKRTDAVEKTPRDGKLFDEEGAVSQQGNKMVDSG